jgi:hypothetical protein
MVEMQKGSSLYELASRFLLQDVPLERSFRLRELLDRHGIKEFDLQKDRGSWVLDLRDGRRLKLSPQQGGTYRMVLESSGGSHDVGLARLINNHFVLGQQSADNLRRLLGGVVKSTSQPTEDRGPAGGENRSDNGNVTTGGPGRGPVYAGRFPTDEEVLERLRQMGISGPLVPSPSAAGGQPGQPGQQTSRSRSWLEDLTGLLEKIVPWLVLAMAVSRGQRGQSQTNPFWLG